MLISFFFFVGLLMLMNKFYRFIFLLLTLEFFMMMIFFNFSLDLMELMFFFFLNFSVMSSITGMVVMVFLVKTLGMDKVLFWDFIMKMM